MERPGEVTITEERYKSYIAYELAFEDLRDWVTERLMLPNSDKTETYRLVLEELNAARDRRMK